MKDYVIDLATQAALPACLALLGPVIHPASVVVDARSSDGVLAGAAGLLWQSWGKPPGFPVWIHVLPDCRRRGIGSALARALVRKAEGEADALWAAQPLAEGASSSLFASSVGFASAGRQFFFEAEANSFMREIDRVATMLKARGRIPKGAVLAALDERLIEPVATLIRSGLSTSPPDIARMMTASLDANPATAAVDVTRSRVLLVDGVVAGALLSRRQADGLNSTIVSNVVAPEFRRGWANAVLLEGTTRAGVEGGCERFRFDCTETNLDTIGLAKRCGAQLLRTEALFRYALASAA